MASRLPPIARWSPPISSATTRPGLDSIYRDGSVASGLRDTYAHAFAMFATAHYFRLTGDRGALDLADRTWAYLDAHLAVPAGGFADAAPRPDAIRRQNPHMHLLEAAMWLFDASGERKYLDRAQKIAGLFRTAFLDRATGSVIEYLDDALSPAQGDPGAIREPGHHYEWAWLLEWLAQAGGAAADDSADRIIRHAEFVGWSGDGLIFDEVYADGRVCGPGFRLWPLTEAIKAHAVWRNAETGARAARLARIVAALRTKFLASAVPGGWIDRYAASGNRAVEFMPASSLYHLFCAYSQLDRLVSGKGLAGQAGGLNARVARTSTAACPQQHRTAQMRAQRTKVHRSSPSRLRRATTCASSTRCTAAWCVSTARCASSSHSRIWTPTSIARIPYEILSLADLDDDRLWGMAERYNITEFNTSIKPYVFAQLMDRYPGEPILYFDPDIFVVSRLREIEQAFENGADAVLTPHLIDPLDHPLSRDEDLLKYGIYNFGFVGLRACPEAAKLAAWWCDRMENRCLIDFPNGLFVDQKLGDFVPAYLVERLCAATSRLQRRLLEPAGPAGAPRRRPLDLQRARPAVCAFFRRRHPESGDLLAPRSELPSHRRRRSRPSTRTLSRRRRAGRT